MCVAASRDTSFEDLETVAGAASHATASVNASFIGCSFLRRTGRGNRCESGAIWTRDLAAPYWHDREER
jgi:hypothetical protein